MKYFAFLLAASLVTFFPNTSRAQSYTQTTGEMGSRESPYASVRGWDVLVGTTNGRFEYCVAVNPNFGSPWRLGISIHGQWQLSVGYQSGSDWQGKLEVDGDIRHASGSATKSWTVLWLSLDELARVKRGNQMIVSIGKADFDASLAGTTAAVLKVEECLQNQGRQRTTQRRQPQPRVAQQPRPNTVQPRPRPNTVQPRPNTVHPQPRRQNNIALKSQLSGTWIWSDKVKDSKNNLIVSTIKITGNNTLNYCYGVFCWDVNFSMNAHNEIDFSTNGTDHFTLYDDGANAVHGEFWEFGNTQAHPDARVDFR